MKGQNTVLILSGGIGTRMQMGNQPKQYLVVQGRPILDYCLCTFQNHEMVDKIVIVADKEWHGFIHDLLQKSGIKVFWELHVQGLLSSFTDQSFYFHKWMMFCMGLEGALMTSTSMSCFHRSKTFWRHLVDILWLPE